MSSNSMPLRSGALKRRDLRKSRRYSVDEGVLRVSWLGLNGTLKVVQQARVLNVSEEGIAVELPAPALLASRVGLEASKHQLHGEGTVKRCRPVGFKFVVGIEFVNGLHWQAPDDSIAEPVPLSGPEE
jgi:hypothetical protein